MNLAELKSMVKDWTMREDIDTLIPGFASMGQDILENGFTVNGKHIVDGLRIPEMEKTSIVNVATDTTFIPLPSDYIELIDLKLYVDTSSTDLVKTNFSDESGWNTQYRKISTFAATTAYQLGEFVMPVAGGSYAYEVTTAGTSATEPAWPTSIGDTIASGTVTFTCRQKQSAARPFKYFRTPPGFQFVTPLDRAYQVRARYYAKQPALVSDSDKNLWSESYPNALLFATLVAIGPFLGDDPRITAWAQSLSMYMGQVSSRSRREIIGGYGLQAFADIASYRG